MIDGNSLSKFMRGEMTWAQVEGMTRDQATTYMKMGVAFFGRGDFEQAAKVFECLTVLNPKDADSHALLGSVRQAEEKPEEAIRCFAAALALDPRHLVALAGRGELRMQAGEKEGLQDLQRAAEIDPMGKTVSGKRAAQIVRALAFQTKAAVPGTQR